MAGCVERGAGVVGGGGGGVGEIRLSGVLVASAVGVAVSLVGLVGVAVTVAGGVGEATTTTLKPTSPGVFSATGSAVGKEVLVTVGCASLEIRKTAPTAIKPTTIKPVTDPITSSKSVFFCLNRLAITVLPDNTCVVRENVLTTDYTDYTDFLFFLIREIRVIRGLKYLVAASPRYVSRSFFIDIVFRVVIFK
jgi:hypothetical protein